MRLVGPDVLHVSRNREKTVNSGHTVECEFNNRISLDGKFEGRREIDTLFWQDGVVLHIARQRVEHTRMALDERPVGVAEMLEELRSR